MDFVVVGFGLGALGILLGVILRGWIAGRCERAAARASDPAVAAYEQANAAECRGAGQAFLAAGGAVVLATVGGLAGGLNDRTGAFLVATTATVAALGVILWGSLYRLRHPMPPRPRRHAAPEQAIGSLAGNSDFVSAEPPVVGPVLAPISDPIPLAGDEGAAARRSEESGGPNSAKPTEPLDGSDADAALQATDSPPGETWREDANSSANGHPADGAAVALDTKIVAFVGRGARATTEEDVDVDGDDRFDER